MIYLKNDKNRRIEISKYHRFSEKFMNSDGILKEKYLDSEEHEKFLTNVNNENFINNELQYRFFYDDDVKNLSFYDIISLNCITDWKGDLFSLNPIEFRDQKHDKMISVLDLVKRIDSSYVDEILPVKNEIFDRWLDEKVANISLSNTVFPTLLNIHLNSLGKNTLAPLLFACAIFDAYDRVSKQMSDYSDDKGRFIKKRKNYWFEHRAGHFDISDTLSEYHLDQVEDIITDKFREKNYPLRQPSQPDTVYIWTARNKTDDRILAKIGIAHHTRLRIRIMEVARHQELEVESACAKLVGPLWVRAHEKKFMQFGQPLSDWSGDGYTEFRLLSNFEYSKIISAMAMLDGKTINTTF